MSRKRSLEALEAHRARFVEGALAKGVDAGTADMVYDKLVGFSGFGFPKSHAAAFALLAYQSAWLRRYYPAEFLCALLNAQPMGFYPPASLVRDGERRGVRVLAPDVNASEAQCSIEDGAVRVGVGYVSGVGEKEADAVASGKPYVDLRDLAQRAPADRSWPDRAGLEALVESGACDCFGEPRRAMLWELGLVPRPQSVLGTRGEAKQLALPLEPTTEVPDLPEHTRWERMLADYRTTNLSVGPHPLELLRPLLPGEVITTAELAGKRDGEGIAIAGLAVARQRPSTAKGVVFMLLEDEVGLANLVVQPHVYERFRPLVRGEPLLLARGRLERVGRNLNVVVARLESLGPLAREAAGLMEVRADLPSAHHFGHR
jgi:error-prone DNA polymerase